MGEAQDTTVGIWRISEDNRRIRMADCHPDRRHVAHGLCEACYSKMRVRFRPERRAKTMADCHPDRPLRAKGLCAQCYNRDWKRARTPMTTQPRPKPMRPPTMATCHPDRPMTARGLCASCYQRDRRKKVTPEQQRAWQQRHRERHPDYTRRKTLRLRYNLTLEGLAAMRDRQDGRCAICQEPLPEKYDIDHDHATGRVRGLLCGPCNRGLGSFRDDTARLRAAVAYLERVAPD